MRIVVRVKPNAKEEGVEPVSQATLAINTDSNIQIYKASVKEPAIEGRANEAVIKILAKYFNVKRSHVRLISGAQSKQKLFEISNDV